MRRCGTRLGPVPSCGRSAPVPHPPSEPGVRISRTGLPGFTPCEAMRPTSGDTACLPLCGDGVSLEPLKPSLPFPLCAAFPRSEYCERVRLLLACPPPFGPAFGWGVRARGAGRSPEFRPGPLSAMPWSPTPPRSPAISPVRTPTCCLPGSRPRRPSDNPVSRLNPFALAGYGLVVALSTLRRRPRGRPRKTRFAVAGWAFGGGNPNRSDRSAWSRRTQMQV